MTRRIDCPSCGVTLRVAATLAAGKRIKCPKCEEGFPVPAEEDDDDRLAEEVAARARQLARKSGAAEDDEEAEERPAPKKRRRKPQKSAGLSPVLLMLLIGGAVLLTGAAVTAGVVFWPKSKTSDAVAEATTPVSKPADPAPSEPAPERPNRNREPASRGQDRGQSQSQGQGQQPPPQQPEQPPPQQPQQPQQPFGGTGSAGGGSDLLAAGRRVFEQHNCARCHSAGGQRGRGPDLSSVGRNPQHTAEWLMAYVSNPRSVRPNSRMPGFADKINDQDLRALGAYLTSLK